MSRLVPDGFLTIRQATDKLAVAMYSGIPDRSIVEGFKELGIDVADGAANDEAFDEIWAAVDGGKSRRSCLGQDVLRPSCSPLSCRSRSLVFATREEQTSICCAQVTRSANSSWYG